MMDDVALARWQGMIDERTARSVDRLDTINGDVRAIKLTLAKIEEELIRGADDRREWTPVLKELATSEAVQTGIAEILNQRKSAGLSTWQRWAAAAGILAVFVNLALRLVGVDGL